VHDRGWADELAERRRPLLDAVAVLVEHDLRGMCDGPTTVDLDWERTPGLVLDLSALLSHRKALRLVLTAVVGWLAGVMYGQPDRQKLNIIDEVGPPSRTWRLCGICRTNGASVGSGAAATC
jgi:hypothetical protein